MVPGPAIELRVLGPLTLTLGTERRLPPRDRDLLALLACRPNALVPAGQLVDALWPAQPPRTAAKALQVRVHELRRALGDPGRIRHDQQGYVLADAELALGRHSEIVELLRAEQAEHPLREAMTARVMLALHRAGRPAEALREYRELHRRFAAELDAVPTRALRELRAAIVAGDRALDPHYRAGAAGVLNNRAHALQGMGAHDRALRYQRRSFAAFQALGNPRGASIARANLGWASQRAGRPGEALAHHRAGLRVFRAVGDRYNEAEQHWALGLAQHALGEPAVARASWHDSVALLVDLGHLGDDEGDELLAAAVPATPEVIRLNS